MNEIAVSKIELNARRGDATFDVLRTFIVMHRLALLVRGNYCYEDALGLFVSIEYIVKVDYDEEIYSIEIE